MMGMDGDEFQFEIDGTKCIGWHGKTLINRDKNGVVRVVSGVWQEVSEEVGKVDMEELKPCPFCGGEALSWPAYDPGWWQVGCSNDECVLFCYTPSCVSVEEAACIWNTRNVM